ncbi:MAG: VWA domain-containing protein [Treponema sp.]|nr:VWA domain-containing protein [Treponema sp.]MCL2271733.1 VWA domain-containing protein [Treponema sp.]
MNFNFENQLIAIAAFMFIPVTVLIYSKLRNPFVASVPLGAPGGIPFKNSQINILIKIFKCLEIAGISLLFLAAAGPSLKTSETVWMNRGADIIFILDVSPSMAAIDMDGRNRFTAAKTLLSDFVSQRPSDNIGLVATGEDAALLLPPTSDREALLLRLEQLRIGEFGDGTALGMGIAVAAYHLEKSGAKRKAAIIITDGENNAGAIHPETAAAMLLDIGASFYVIAAGSAGEVPIDYTDPFTRIRRTGIFDSRFDAESLRRLSASGGGTFISAPSLDAFAAAFSRIDDEEMTVLRSRVFYKKYSLFFHFLTAAAVILVSIRFFKNFLLRAVL